MLYTLLCGHLVMYSNYFETVSTVTNQNHFQVAFNTVLLYDYYYIMVAIICAMPGFYSSFVNHLFLVIRCCTFKCMHVLHVYMLHAWKP